MAQTPEDRVLMVHPDVKDDDGKPIEVEVSRYEFGAVWETVGWKLSTKNKEK